MKKIKNGSQGFTLLELLIVVLIIGILAAIALPQYQLSRDKTEFIKLQSVAVSLRDAYNEYILIHGRGTRNFGDLSVNLPSDFQSSYTSVSFNCVSNDNMFCCISDSGESHSAAIMCGKNDLSFLYTEGFLGKNNNYNVSHLGICKAVKDNVRAHRLCSSVGKAGTNTNAAAWTPKGTKTGYTNYVIN